MIYIKNKNQFFKNTNESFLNPGENRDVDIEFEDTLGGRLLSKIFGKSRDFAKKTAVSSLANRLDKTIATLFIDNTKKTDTKIEEKINVAEDAYTTAAMLDFINDTVYLLSDSTPDNNKIETMLSVCDDLLENDKIKSEYIELIEQTKNVLTEIQKTDNQEKNDKSADKNIIALPPATIESKHAEVMNRLKNIDGFNKLNEPIKEFIDDYYSNKNDLISEVDKLKEQTSDSRLDKIIDRYIYLLKQYTQDNWEDVNINELFQSFTYLYNKINNKNESYVINEADINTIKKSLLDSLKKAKDSIKKSDTVSKEDMKSIDDAIKNSGNSFLDGTTLKKITDLIQQANKKILRNDFNSIQKNQKKYYIPLANNSNIAKNKAAYDEWSKKINNMVAYYNDILPEKVNNLLLDSLDDEYMTSFNKLLSKYLSKADADKYKVSDASKQTTDVDKDNADNNKPKKLSISKTDKIKTITDDGKRDFLYRPFIVKTDKNYIVLIPIYINANMVTCKYKANNIKWLNTYLGQDNIDNRGIYNELLQDDNNDVKLCTFRLKDTILIGDDYTTARSAFKVVEMDDINLIDMKATELFILSDIETKIPYKINYNSKTINKNLLPKYKDSILKNETVKNINLLHFKKIKNK